MMANRPRLVIAVVAFFLSLPLSAQEDDVPTDDFLEYLATLVEDNGEWIDPMELDELSDDELDVNKADQQPDDTQSAEEIP